MNEDERDQELERLTEEWQSALRLIGRLQGVTTKAIEDLREAEHRFTKYLGHNGWQPSLSEIKTARDVFKFVADALAVSTAMGGRV